MPNPTNILPDEPTESSINELTRNLRSDREKKGVSSKNYAHRARVIRQQKELLARSQSRDSEARSAPHRQQLDGEKHAQPSARRMESKMNSETILARLK